MSESQMAAFETSDKTMQPRSFYDYFSYELMLETIRKKWIWFLAVIALCAGLGAGFARFSYNPTYTSTGTLYLRPALNGSSLDYYNMSVNSKIFASLAKMMVQDPVLNVVAEDAGLANAGQVRAMLDMNTVSGTEMMTIKAESGDAAQAALVVNSTMDTIIRVMDEEMGITNLEVLQYATEDTSVSKPSYMLWAATFAILGFLGCAAYVVIKAGLSQRMVTRDIAEYYLEVPVLSVIVKD